MKPQRVISATRDWEYFAKDYLRTVFPRVLLGNAIGLFERGGRVTKSFFIEKPNKTTSFFEVIFKALC